MVAIRLWVAIRWSSVTVAVAAGMSATVAGFMIGQSRFGHWYPWSLPVQLFARCGSSRGVSSTEPRARAAWYAPAAAPAAN